MRRGGRGCNENDRGEKGVEIGERHEEKEMMKILCDQSLATYITCDDNGATWLLPQTSPRFFVVLMD